MSFDVMKCAIRLQPWIIRTPLVEIESLSELTGKRVFLKLESMQRTGAFKFRGAMNYMLTLDKTTAERGVITASSGNHGLGMSLGSKLVGLKCTVVMPVTAPLVKQRRARGYGATVVLNGNSYDEAQEHAKTLADAQGSTYVPSFNHPRIIEGQGTILAEIMADLPEADTIVAPVGGGGLIAGLLVAQEQLGSQVRIVGVEPHGAACMKASLEAGRLTTLTELITIADGVAVRTPGTLNFEIVQRLKPHLMSVSDNAIKDAQRMLLHEEKLIVETAGAVPVAAVLAEAVLSEANTVVCVISGANVDLSYLEELLK